MKDTLQTTTHTLARAVVTVLVLAGAMLAVGCDKPNNAAPDAGTSKENPLPTSSAPPVKPPPLARPTANGGSALTIDGVGEVPPWRRDETTKRCVVSADSKAKIDALRKGTDAARKLALAAGTADIAALAKDVGADACILTRRALASALDDLGTARLFAKSYDDANHFWRAALVVRPSFVAARYDLARGLALTGKSEPAAAEIAEIARAADEGDANAAGALEKAKNDVVFESIRSQPSFQNSLKALNEGLVGPRKDPATAAKAVALLPEEFKKLQDDIGATPNRAIITFKPAFTNFWTWHPDASTELLVATVVDDPAKIGQPKADITLDYGAIAVLRRDAAGALTLLTLRKTGDSQPTVAAGKNGSVIYSFEQACGGLSGKLTWNGKSIDMNEKNCRDL